jgi:hypothetical protein
VAPAILVCMLLLLACEPVTTVSPAAGSSGPTPSPAVSKPPASADASGTPAAPIPSADPVPIEVVDLGFTIIPDDASGSVAYAAVLRNPNTEWALQRAEVLVDLLGSDGAFIAGADVVLTLLPGQTSAIVGQVSGAAEAATLDVRPSEDLTGFVPRADTAETFDAVDVLTRQSGTGWLTTGTLVSRFATTQSFVEVIAVNRDANGSLLSGATVGVEVIEPGATVTFEVLDSVPHHAIGRTDIFWQLTR